MKPKIINLVDIHMVIVTTDYEQSILTEYRKTHPDEPNATLKDAGLVAASWDVVVAKSIYVDSERITHGVLMISVEDPRLPAPTTMFYNGVYFLEL